MATDATGAPTPLGIPKYNTSVDAPSGLGFNATMDAIDALITAKQLPTATGSNKVPVWNGTSWVAQTVPPAAITPGSAGQVLGMLSGAAAWLGGMSKIFDSTAGGTVASFDTGAAGIPADYAHLLVVAYLRGDTATAFTLANARFNNDSTAAYDAQSLTANGVTVATAGTTAGATTAAQVGRVPANTAPANAFSAQIIFIPNYKGTVGHKSFIGLSIDREATATTSDNVLNLTGGVWASVPAAISRLAILPSVGNFVAGSQVSIYGIGV